MSERQSTRMSKNTNDSLTRYGTGCYIVVATVGVKGPVKRIPANRKITDIEIVEQNSTVNYHTDVHWPQRRRHKFVNNLSTQTTVPTVHPPDEASS